MSFEMHFNADWLARLCSHPKQSFQSQYNSSPYSARIAIPNYREQLLDHYRDILHGDINGFCQRAQIPLMPFAHYGVIIHFTEPQVLALHDAEMAMNTALKGMIGQVGAVIIQNAYMELEFRNRCHRNRFPQLNFHVDRSGAHPTHYSLYSRDPFDAEQRYPRTSSTLFIPSLTGHLQAIREGQISANTQGLKSTYTLFTNEAINDLSGHIILEHRWDEPEGSGELSMLDNLTSLHASYYPDPGHKGYKIGVRYLS